jgi:Flp pilus assembly protein TadD
MLRNLTLAAALMAATLQAASPEVERAKKLYARASYKAAIDALNPVAQNSGDYQVFLLLGRSQFMVGDYKRATESFEKAVSLKPNDSDLHHWLGKSYGRRAETANPISAPGLANKARQSFEKAVELNPRNVAAVDDLFEYYLEAPGFLGGGLNKAEALAEKIKAIDASEYHYAIAQLAEKRKDFNRAEEQLRRAVDAAPKQVARVLDLGRFLAKRGRYQESEAVFAQAEKIDPKEPRILFERANAYIRAKQNLDAAKQLLERYIQSPIGPDDPPIADAQKLLKQAAGA